MFKIVTRYPCTRDDGKEEQFGSNVFLTFVTCFAMLVVIAPFFYKELREYNQDRKLQGLSSAYPYPLRSHLLTILPALLEVSGLIIALTANMVLDASVMVLLKSIRIPVSAFMNKYIIGKALHRYQVAAVVITILGVIPVMASTWMKDVGNEEKEVSRGISSSVAIAMVATAEVFKGIRYVYEERLIKIEKLSSEFLVFMQSIIDTLVSIVFIVVAHNVSNKLVHEDWYNTWTKLSGAPGLWALLFVKIALVGFHNYTSTLITEKLSSLHNVLISQGRVVVTAVFMALIELCFAGMGEKVGLHTAINTIGYVFFIAAALIYSGSVKLPWSSCYPEESDEEKLVE